MRIDWKRAYRLSVLLSSGGIAAGIFQSFALINWSDLWTNFLSLFFSSLVRALLTGATTGLFA